MGKHFSSFYKIAFKLKFGRKLYFDKNELKEWNIFFTVSDKILNICVQIYWKIALRKLTGFFFFRMKKNNKKMAKKHERIFFLVFIIFKYS